MNIIIRKAKIQDLKTIQNLNYQLFIHDSEFENSLNLEWPFKEGEEYFKNKIEGLEGACFVAEGQDKVVGYLAGGIRNREEWLKQKRSEVDNMFVLKEFRKEGIGRKLIEAFVEWSKSQQATKVVVNSFYGNEEGIGFYQKVGFVSYDISLELRI